MPEEAQPSWWGGRDGVVGRPVISRDFAMARVWYGFMTARVMIAAVLLLLQISIFWLGQPITEWILVFCMVYLLATIVVRAVAKPAGYGQNFDPQWLASIGLDLFAYSLLQWVQLGGINYTPLYALPVLLASVLGSALLALGTAAGVTLLLLVDAWWMGGQNGDVAARYLQAALTGTGFFVVAFLANQLASRLVREEQVARRSQSAARTQIQVNELVIETLGDGIVVVDAHGIVRMINPAARRLLGSAGLERSLPFVLVAEAAWQPLVELSRQTFALHRSQSTDAQILYPGQSAQRIHVRTRLTGSSKNVSNEMESLCVMFVQDLRETEARIRTEKMAAMGRMSAAVAHEIRNPLAAISQANALLMEDLAAPGPQQLTRMVAHNAQRLARIVDEILDIARVQNVAQLEAPEPIAIDSVVQTTCLEWAQQNQCAERLQLDNDVAQVKVVFEEEHLRRVLVNLLDNAKRYASAARNAIWVGTECLGMDGVRLCVWSDGAPLEASVQAHLFEPFFSSESRSSGLGLYICRELCERYGATIGYERTQRAGISGNAFFVQCRMAVQEPVHALRTQSNFAALTV